MTVPAAILHVPHSSSEVPADVRLQFLLDDKDLADELRLMTDWHTAELFDLPADEAVTVRFPVSRLVTDPERFADPEAERMEAVGMGAVYTKTSHGAPLRDKAEAAREREALLARYYRPHHAVLEAATAAALDAHGRCLIVDCHSFPSRPLPYEFKVSADRWSVIHRPAVCIGTDATLPPHAPFSHAGMHTPQWLRERAAEACAEMLGRWPDGGAPDPAFTADEATQEGPGKAVAGIAFDRPFAGALVPLPYLGSERRVHAVMIELRRDLYMDEGSGARLAGFAGGAAAVKAALRRLIA
ncbi:MAG: N-formylglutamate amidohydrolase [Actinobacteria bacterium]|nr:N-formylglutamate amidohydrolase [Actinomycetota bacterium]